MKIDNIELIEEGDDENAPAEPGKVRVIAKFAYLGEVKKKLTHNYDLHNLGSRFSGGLVHLNAVRVAGRSGGLHARDRRFRRQLAQQMGVIALAGGHIEAALMRLILDRQGAPTATFEAIRNHNWGKMQEDLLVLVPQEAKLIQLLHEGSDLRQRRNDVLHGDWLYYWSGMVQNRRNTKGKPSTIFVAEDLAPLHALGRELERYSENLDAHLADSWPTAWLPKID